MLAYARIIFTKITLNKSISKDLSDRSMVQRVRVCQLYFVDILIKELKISPEKLPREKSSKTQPNNSNFEIIKKEEKIVSRLQKLHQ